MGNEMITSDMSMIDMMMLIFENNPVVFKVLMQMMQNLRNMLDIILLDYLDIRDYKIWMLYSDS